MSRQQRQRRQGKQRHQKQQQQEQQQQKLRQRKEDIDITLDRVLNAVCSSRSATPEIALFVTRTIADLRSHDIPTKTAKEFDLDDAVYLFNLKYRDPIYSRRGLVGSWWGIEDIPETKGFPVSPCSSKFKLSHSTVDLYLMVWV